MKKGLTEMVFILDRSGSMSGLERDTIGGYNSMLERQQKESGEARVTTVLFDDRYELLHDRIALHEVSPMTEKEYYVRGNTALLDAVGRTIAKVGADLDRTAEEERAEHVVVVITTDGMENSSQEFSEQKVRGMIEHQKEKYGWEFIFLGANIDAIATAERYGIGKERAANYNADGVGTMLNYAVLSNVMSCVRDNRPIKDDWKALIDKDYNKRGKS